MSPLRQLSVTLLCLSLVSPAPLLAQPLSEPQRAPQGEPQGASQGEPLSGPSATLLFGTQLEIGGVLAPSRGASARARLPWRPREEHGLYPVRAMASLEARRGSWSARSQARLYARQLWLGAPQAPSYQDPLGTGVGLNELSLSFHTQVGGRLTLQTKAGRWTPDADRGLSPWCLEASERLWSLAPDPRDRTVTGASLTLSPRAGLASSAWVPRSMTLSAFTPSVELTPQPEERRPGLRGLFTWRYAHLSELRASGGGLRGGPRWARLTYTLNTETLEGEQEGALKGTRAPIRRAGFIYTGSLLYRAGSRAPLPYVEAVESSLGGYGEGLVATHTLTKQLGRGSVALGYEWRDPQLDFAYNAQHTLSLRCQAVVYNNLSVSLEHRHLWSARDDRLSFGSSLTFAQLRWSPTWAF